MTEKTDSPIDLVWGIAAIARLIGRSERHTYDMCASGHLPARQVGNRWVAKREAIVKFFDEPAA